MGKLMIHIYQGIDVVEISRFRKIFLDHKEFASDTFTNEEKKYCFSKPDTYPYFAQSFAAKEASLKALGIGFSGMGISHVFQQIEVIPHPIHPTLTFVGWIEKIFKKRSLTRSFVSLSFSNRHAIALVVLAGTCKD